LKKYRFVALAAAGCVALGAAFGASAEKKATPAIPAFTNTQLTANAGADWIAPHGDIFNQRFSTLTDVNATNVKGLKMAWHIKLAIPGLKAKLGPLGSFAEASPVVYGGVAYMADGNYNVYALDATTGERLWFYKPKFPKGFTPLLSTRGVAIGDGKVYHAMADASIAALDQATGRVKWRTKTADWKDGYYFTNAPQYWNGLVITGESGGDSGAACKVVALNAKTGKIVWTFDVIPQKKGQLGYNTWPLHRAWVGGGAMWNTPVIDPRLGLVYVGVGNPIPYSGLTRGPGAELFTDSMLALHAKTGKYAWHFQVVHHDIWDYDVTNPFILYDMKYKGRMTPAIVHANKNGFLYILNRRNGKPILGIREKKVPQSAAAHTFATQPWPRGQAFSSQCPNKAQFSKLKAPDGKPYKVGCIYTTVTDKQFTVFAPNPLGGADWPPSSFSPQTGFMYICSKNGVASWKDIPEDQEHLKPLGDFSQVVGLTPKKGSPASRVDGTLVAMNLRNNRVAWTVTWPKDMCYSGVMSTAGNLTFVGRNGGFLQAYNSRNGKLLWTSPKLRAGVNAPAVTYTANGKQYIVVFAGGNGIATAFGGVKPNYGSELYAFALPG